MDALNPSKMQNTNKMDHKYQARKLFDIYKAFLHNLTRYSFNHTGLLHAHTILTQILGDMGCSWRVIDHKYEICSFNLLPRGE